MAADDRRLHPLSWLFTAARFAKGFLVPALLFLLASGGAAYELWGALFVGPVIAAAVVQYRVYRYRLAADEMIVRDGVLTRTERRIPYRRIQNIDLVQNPLHRLFGVALVRVETASGARPEAVMRVLSLDAAAEMRAQVFAGRPAARAAAVPRAAKDASSCSSTNTVLPGGAAAPAAARQPGDLPLLQVPARELVKLGIVSNKGMVVVAAAFGLFAQARPEERVFEPLEPLLRSAADRLPLGAAADWLSALRFAYPVPTAVLLAVTAVVLALVLLRVLSVAWFLLRLHGFTLTRRGSDLRADYGLFTRVSRTIPTVRIQSLTATESPLHRWFDRQSIELRTVGGAASADVEVGYDASFGEPKAESQWLAPMVETARVPVLLRQVLPDVDLAGVAWRPLAARAGRRVLVRGLAVAAAATLLGGMAAGLWGLAIGAPAALAAFVHARRWTARAGYAVTAWGVLFRSGWWTRRLAMVPLARIQTVGLGESPFDRRHGMASVRIDTAGAAAAGYTIAIPYLEKAVAAEVVDRLYAEAGRRAFRW